MTGVIFDFNGTMFFDEEFQEISWRQFIKDTIGRRITDEEFQEHVHGRNADYTFPLFLGRPLTRQEIMELEEGKERIYRELCLQSEKFRLAPGLERFLDYLAGNDIPRTIATASGWNNVRFFFQHLGLGKWFDLGKVVYNDGTIPGKPAPDLFLVSAERIKVPTKECIVFEDSLSGIEAARNAGVRAVVRVDSMRQTNADTLADETISDFWNAQEIMNKFFSTCPAGT